MNAWPSDPIKSSSDSRIVHKTKRWSEYIECPHFECTIYGHQVFIDDLHCRFQHQYPPGIETCPACAHYVTHNLRPYPKLSVPKRRRLKGGKEQSPTATTKRLKYLLKHGPIQDIVADPDLQPINRLAPNLPYPNIDANNCYSSENCFPSGARPTIVDWNDLPVPTLESTSMAEYEFAGTLCKLLVEQEIEQCVNDIESRIFGDVKMDIFDALMTYDEWWELFTTPDSAKQLGHVIKQWNEIDEINIINPLSNLTLSENENISNIPAEITTSQQWTTISENIYNCGKRGTAEKHSINLGKCQCNIRSQCGHQCTNRIAHIECDENNCAIGLNGCTNQEIKNSNGQPMVKVIIKDSNIKGKGLFSVEPVISRNQFIIEYIGEVITDKQVQKRLKDQLKSSNELLLYSMEISPLYYVDAAYYGNQSRFVNHSCEPNCVVEKWTIENHTRLGIFAKRQIQYGEELTIDYKFDTFTDENMLHQCYCASQNCRKYINKSTTQLTQ